MSAAADIVKRFYPAAQAADGGAILAILHPRFQARIAPGMRVADGRISWLHQYTDTARWHEALA